jgi:curved DNA-binding protein CbpA
LAVDPYTALGVKKDATQDQIQKAYRRLAKKLHPDINPGNKIAEEKFKEVAAANDLLSDPNKRARFDRGEIDASGTERPRQQYYRDFAENDRERRRHCDRFAPSRSTVRAALVVKGCSGGIRSQRGSPLTGGNVATYFRPTSKERRRRRFAPSTSVRPHRSRR